MDGRGKPQRLSRAKRAVVHVVEAVCWSQRNVQVPTAAGQTANRCDSDGEVGETRAARCRNVPSAAPGANCDLLSQSQPVPASLNPLLAAGGDRPRMPWCDWGFGTHRDQPRSSLFTARRPPSPPLSGRSQEAGVLPLEGTGDAGSCMCCPALASRSAGTRCLLQGPLHSSQPPLGPPPAIGCHPLVTPRGRLPVTHHLPHAAKLSCPEAPPRPAQGQVPALTTTRRHSPTHCHSPTHSCAVKVRTCLYTM